MQMTPFQDYVSLPNFKLRKYLRRDAKLVDSFIHGVDHWKKVERNGVYLCQFNGADEKVVRYFAFLHDCMRENEHHDEKHGPRAAKYALRVAEHINLNKEQMRLLCIACRGHTFGRKEKDLTVSTCWDADRLDIGRVGIQPNAKYLFSDEAKRIANEEDEAVLDAFIYKTWWP